MSLSSAILREIQSSYSLMTVTKKLTFKKERKRDTVLVFKIQFIWKAYTGGHHIMCIWIKLFLLKSVYPPLIQIWWCFLIPASPLPCLTLHLQPITWSRADVIEMRLIRCIPNLDTIEDSGLMSLKSWETWVLCISSVRLWSWYQWPSVSLQPRRCL